MSTQRVRTANQHLGPSDTGSCWKNDILWSKNRTNKHTNCLKKAETWGKHNLSTPLLLFLCQKTKYARRTGLRPQEEQKLQQYRQKVASPLHPHSIRDQKETRELLPKEEFHAEAWDPLDRIQDEETEDFERKILKLKMTR